MVQVSQRSCKPHKPLASDLHGPTGIKSLDQLLARQNPLKMEFLKSFHQIAHATDAHVVQHRLHLHAVILIFFRSCFAV